MKNFDHLEVRRNKPRKSQSHLQKTLFRKIRRSRVMEDPLDGIAKSGDVVGAGGAQY